MTSCNLETFGAVFSTFSASLFRFEALPKYVVEGEIEHFEEFERGDAEPSKNFMSGWHQMLEAAKADGKIIDRVRAFSDPISAYERFEYEWGFKHSLSKGENIRGISVSEVEALTAGLPIVKDFWLVDESACFLMEYDQVGNFLGFSAVPEDLVPRYVESSKKLMAASSEISEFIK